MSEKIPTCARYLRHDGCERSNVIVAAEGDEHWGFKCLTCGSFRIVSKPRGRERARYEQAVARQLQMQRVEPRRIWFS